MVYCIYTEGLKQIPGLCCTIMSTCCLLVCFLSKKERHLSDIICSWQKYNALTHYTNNHVIKCRLSGAEKQPGLLTNTCLQYMSRENHTLNSSFAQFEVRCFLKLMFKAHGGNNTVEKQKKIFCLYFVTQTLFTYFTFSKISHLVFEVIYDLFTVILKESWIFKVSSFLSFDINGIKS